MSATVRVRREGGRGHHLISKAKYDADPAAFVRCDEIGNSIEAAKTASTSAGNGGGNIDDLDYKTVLELRALAAERDIDLGDATKKADIIAAIEAAKTGD